MDFFALECRETPIDLPEFGIRDGVNNAKAFVDINPSNTGYWVAIVKNENRLKLVFTAIDKCVIQDNEFPGRGRCDGMLTSSEHLYFIELKEEKESWITDATHQLESTIQFFHENHSSAEFRFKKAFACNRRHPRFREIDNETNLRFFRKYGFRLDIQAEIIVV